jgi:hypothetical protein
VASATKLIVNLEYPGVDVELIGDQCREQLVEVLLAVDVLGSDWNRYVCLLEYSLRAGLC